MSRLLTLTELYSLVLEYDIHKAPDETGGGKNALPQPMALNAHSPVLWVGAAKHPTPVRPLQSRRVAIAPDLAEMMHDLAADSDLSEAEAWSEAAQTWIAQRQHDMVELTSPTGRTLAAAVQRVWLTIDDQMRELRAQIA